MFRSMSGEGHLSSPGGRGGVSPALESQENSWIGLLSRPAMAFLHRYLPGRLLTPAKSDTGPGWSSGGLKNNFAEEESEFLRQLDDIMPLTQHPAPHLSYLGCQHDEAAGLLEPKGGSTLPWLTADSLREIGIQSTEEMDINIYQQPQIGYLSPVRTFFSHVLLSSVSSQEIKPTVDKNKSGRRWWGSFWGGEESSHKDPSWAEDAPGTAWLYPQQPVTQTKATTTTDTFVQTGGRSWTLGENAGPADLKEEPANNGGLDTVQNAEGSPRDLICNHLGCSGAAAACSEVALLTPDQDNGYSSLEEEHFQVKVVSQEQPQQEEVEEEKSATCMAEMEEDSSEGEPTSGKEEDEGEEEEEEEEEVLITPQCQNKAIAFIMGCPCSDDDDDDESRSQGGSSGDEDDDDGFNSEGSSDLSGSSSEDEENDDEDSEEDSEAERLWSSMCQSVDPYNPRNFTACLHTTPPRAIPSSTPLSSTHSTPDASPDVTPLPLSSLSVSPPVASPSSPPSGSDTWDDSTSASEVDEAESLRLWSSFSSSLDPYSPFNFQAPLRTREPRGSRTRTRKSPSRFPCHHIASPPQYRKEEAEERLDSGFSEASTSSTTKSCTKKVRFCDEVEEFFASCGEEDEDRRGPWEELARDRCRFLRRCQEVEQSIDYCLQPQHRSLVYRRLASNQDA